MVNMLCRRLMISITIHLIATTSFAVVVPNGLQPGDAYHLAFVTGGTRWANDDDIEIYNDFVREQAALNPEVTGVSEGVDWYVIGSSPLVHARENALVQAPVFLLDGTRVADGFDDLWDGDLLAPINVNQFLMKLETHVWTGSQDDGFRDDLSELGNGRPMLGRSDAFEGHTDIGFSGVKSGWLQFETRAAENARPFYALSAKIVVVPEPSGILLAVWVVVVSLRFRNRERRPLSRRAAAYRHSLPPLRGSRAS